MQIRYYSKTQLGSLYFSDIRAYTACRKLMRWINRCQPLCEELRQTNYNPNSRGFTPRQVKLIFDHLGEPEIIND